MTTRLLSGTEMATRGPGIRGRRRELQSPLRPGGSSGAQRPGPRGVGGPSAPVQCAGPSSPRCPCRQPPLAARDRGLGANPGSAAVQEPVAGCGVGLTQTASHLCHRPLACRGFCAQAGLRHSRPAAVRPAGRWSLVPTAPGFCLKQRPTALSPHLWPLPDQLCLLHVFSATKSLLVAFGEGVGCVQVAGVACPSLAAWNTGSLSVQRERGSHLQGRRGQRR